MAQHDPAQEPLALVVDDEALLRMHAADVLQDEGWAVLEAGNAEEALAILKERQDVRLLFTDVQMPGKSDGMDLARQVHDRWPHILLVVTSGRLRPTNGEIPDDGRFVPKPYAPGDLMREVNDLIKTH